MPLLAQRTVVLIGMLALALGLAASGSALPPSSAHVDLVGAVRVHDALDNHIAQVSTLGDYAYLGTSLEPLPGCSHPGGGGVYVVDISDPSAPKEVGFVAQTPVSFAQTAQAIHLDTPAFSGDVLVLSNDICTTLPGAAAAPGGVSLWDVSDPLNPRALALGAGDTDPLPNVPARAHRARHLAAWDAGDRAFVAVNDEEELGTGDVDILEITDPRNPRRIAERSLASWPGAQNAQSAGIGAAFQSSTARIHVRRVAGDWLAVVGYRDAGFVVLNVNDPANPVFVDDFDFPDPDRLTGFSPPEGHAYSAEWSHTGEFLVGVDEDTRPYRVVARITSGPFSGQELRVVAGSATPYATSRNPLAGPSYFLGLACTAVPAAPTADAVAVVERGTCTFQVKFDNMKAAGYRGVIVFNSAAATADSCEADQLPAVNGDRPFVFTTRSTGYKILGIEGYDPARCRTGPNPALPAAGTRGSDVALASLFDGWGYVRLLDSGSLAELDGYAPAVALDERFAEGFGRLSANDVAADPTHDVAYTTWYSAGFRVVEFGDRTLREGGHFVDDTTDLWGLDVHMKPDGRRYVVAANRDAGLSIFRYGTDLRLKPRSSSKRGHKRVVWKVKVANRGTIAATGTSFELALPPGITKVWADASQGRCTTSGRTVVCRLRKLAEDGRAQVVVVGRARWRGTYTATASVSSPEVDYDPRNNRRDLSVRVGRGGKHR